VPSAIGLVYQLFILSKLSKQEKCMSSVKKRGLQDMQYIGPL
jgi:hypothetical protein